MLETILLVAALVLFVIDASASLTARAAQYVRGTVLQSAGLACLTGAVLVSGGMLG